MVLGENRKAKFSHSSGLYDNTLELELATNVISSQIYYTTNGSEPDLTSNLYTKPLLITETTTDEVVLTPPSLTPETGAKLPFVKRYHPKSLTQLFENSSYPRWDTVLENNIMSLDYTEEERIEIMDDIIAEFGKRIFVKTRKSSTKEEQVELTEMMYCVMRNLHLGNRTGQTANVDVNKLNKIKNLADSLKQATEGAASITPIPALDSLTLSVQTEAEFDFDKKYDRLMSLESKGVYPIIPLPDLTPPKRLISETGVSIARPDGNNDIKIKSYRSYVDKNYNPYDY